MPITYTDSDTDSDSETPLSPSRIYDLKFNKKYKLLKNLKPSNYLNKNIRMEGAQANVQTPVLKREYLDMIPDFMGQSELLPRFISLCEKLVNKFYNAINAEDFQNDFLMQSILSKVKGDAAINIASFAIGSWSDLKTALLHTYADKRDCYTLNFEMCELKQTQSESAFDFFNRVNHVLNLQISYIAIHSADEEAVVLSTFVRNVALKVLVRGLRNPIGCLLKVKNPSSLGEALNILTNEFQQEIAGQKFDSIQKKPTGNNLLNASNFRKVVPPVRFQNQNYNTNRPVPNNYVRFNPQYQSPQFANRQNKPPQNFQNSNTIRNTNQFPRPIQNFPQPMSISTRNTFAPRNNPNFKYGELHNLNDEPMGEIEQSSAHSYDNLVESYENLTTGNICDNDLQENPLEGTSTDNCDHFLEFPPGVNPESN